MKKRFTEEITERTDTVDLCEAVEDQNRYRQPGTLNPTTIESWGRHWRTYRPKVANR